MEELGGLSQDGKTLGSKHHQSIKRQHNVSVSFDCLGGNTKSLLEENGKSVRLCMAYVLYIFVLLEPALVGVWVSSCDE